MLTRPVTITGVRRIDSVPVRCVEVDDPSHLYLAGAKSATLSVLGVSLHGELTLLAAGTTAKGAHCVTGDRLNQIWVCDPDHGQLFLFKDEF